MFLLGLSSRKVGQNRPYFLCVACCVAIQLQHSGLHGVFVNNHTWMIHTSLQQGIRRDEMFLLGVPAAGNPQGRFFWIGISSRKVRQNRPCSPCVARCVGAPFQLEQQFVKMTGKYCVGHGILLCATSKCLNRRCSPEKRFH